MLLKRMQRTTTSAKKQLQELQDQYRELEEQMLAVFADVIDETIQTPEDNAQLGRDVRRIFKDYGGADALRTRYEQVSAYHNNNYRPLMWGFYSPYRAELFRLSHLLTFRSATQDQSLIDALHFIQRFQNARWDHLPYEISLEFASVRWQALIRTRRHMETVLNRRPLEVCMFIALFSHFIACGVWEAVYILDALLKNHSTLQPDTLYADTHGQTEPVFGLAALLGIKLMPRMRKAVILRFG